MAHHWKVWTEDDEGEEDTVLCEGAYTKCKRAYLQGGGERAGLHLGHDIPDEQDSDDDPTTEA